jgi:hypothetical protein
MCSSTISPFVRLESRRLFEHLALVGDVVFAGLGLERLARHELEPRRARPGRRLARVLLERRGIESDERESRRRGHLDVLLHLRLGLGVLGLGGSRDRLELEPRERRAVVMGRRVADRPLVRALEPARRRHHRAEDVLRHGGARFGGRGPGPGGLGARGLRRARVPSVGRVHGRPAGSSAEVERADAVEAALRLARMPASFVTRGRFAPRGRGPVGIADEHLDLGQTIETAAGLGVQLRRLRE